MRESSTIYWVEGMEMPLSQALTLKRVVTRRLVSSAWVQPREEAVK